MSVYSYTKFQVSIMNLTSFRQRDGGGGRGNSSTPHHNKPLKSPPRLGLNELDEKVSLKEPRVGC